MSDTDRPRRAAATKASLTFLLAVLLPAAGTPQITEVPVVQPGVGGGAGAAGAVTTGPGTLSSPINLSVPTLGGTHLPSAASPTPLTRGGVAPASGFSAPKAGKAAAAPGAAYKAPVSLPARALPLKTGKGASEKGAGTPRAPAAGSPGFRKGLGNLGRDTGGIRRAPGKDGEKRGAESSARIGASLFDGADLEEVSAAAWGETLPGLPEGLRVTGRIPSAELIHPDAMTGQVDTGGGTVDIAVKINGKADEARILAAMNRVPLAKNVRIPKLIGETALTPDLRKRLDPGGKVLKAGKFKALADEGRRAVAMELLPEDYTSLHHVLRGEAELRPVSARDWQGLLTSIERLHSAGLGFGDLDNYTNIRVRQVPAPGGYRTEFALIDTGQGTLGDKPAILRHDYNQVKGARGLEYQLIAKGLLKAPGKLAEPSPEPTLLAARLLPAGSLGKETQGRDVPAPAVVKPQGSWLGRLLARVASSFKGEESPPGLNNRMMSRKEAVRRMGFDAAKRPGSRMSDPQKTNTTVLSVQAKDGRRAVVKVFTRIDELENELFMRQVFKRFRVFSDRFDVPDGVGYVQGRFLPEGTLLMEHADAGPQSFQFQQLPIADKVSLAVAQTFHLSDFNPNGILFPGGGRKPVVIDFEASGGRNKPNRGRLLTGLILDEMPWVSRHHLNELDDYLPAIAKWKEEYLRPEVQEEIEVMLRTSGMNKARVAKQLEVLRENAKGLEEVIEADVDYANAFFIDEARKAGLADEQIAVLSEINKASHMSPDGIWMRDIVRLVSHRVSKGLENDSARAKIPIGHFILRAEELAAFLRSRPDGLTAADRAAVIGAAEDKDAGAALKALDRLDSLVRTPPALKEPPAQVMPDWWNKKKN